MKKITSEQIKDSLQEFINEHYNKLNKKQLKQLSVLVEQIKYSDDNNDLSIRNLIKIIYTFFKE